MFNHHSRRKRPDFSYGCALVGLIATLGSGAAHAADCNWNGGSGDWHVVSKWSCGRVPTATDAVSISNLSGGTILVTAAAPMASLGFSTDGSIAGSGALVVSGVAAFNPTATTTITTVGSHLPNVSITLVDLGTVFTLNDAALTTESAAP